MRRILLMISGALLVLVLGAGWVLSVPDIPHETLRKRYATPPSQFLKLPGGARVHFRDQGPKTAPVIVLLHGSNASLHTWEGWVKVLTPQYRVLTVDLPGHGLTGAVPSDDYTLKGMRTFVHAFVKARGVDKFALGGNSMGGAVSWKYTLAYPKQVTHLVLVDAAGVPRTSPGKMPVAFRLARVPVLRTILTFITPRSFVAEGIKRCYGNPSKVSAALIDRYYHLNLHPGNRRAMVKRFAKYPILHKVPGLSKIQVPTLILWGAKDTVTPTGMSKTFLTHIRGSKRILYPDLGHVPMEEAPARTAKDVLRFLTKHTPKTPGATDTSAQPKPAPDSAAPQKAATTGTKSSKNPAATKTKTAAKGAPRDR